MIYNFQWHRSKGMVLLRFDFQDSVRTCSYFLEKSVDCHPHHHHYHLEHLYPHHNYYHLLNTNDISGLMVDALHTFSNGNLMISL